MDSPPPSRDRVVEVSVYAGRGFTSGSGYLLGPQLVLTVAHILSDNGAPTLRTAIGGKAVPASVAWVNKDLDVALLATPAPLVTGDVPPVGFSMGSEFEPLATYPAMALGFAIPDGGSGPVSTLPEIVRVSGTVSSTTGARSGSYEFVLDSASIPPAMSAGTHWGGLSGAPLWVGDLIAGVVTGEGAVGSSLRAVRAERLLAEPGFAALVAGSQEDGLAVTGELPAVGPDPAAAEGAPDSASTDAPTSQEPPAHAEDFVRPQQRPGATADTVPEPGEGRVKGADRLDTAIEVEMLVSVLLDRETPLPLAVGLFGDWGSGKSFFMALMEERMRELAALAADGRPEASQFCRDVRPVRFNAWHYADTDLWASLAATLFDTLARADAPERTKETLTKLDEAGKKAEEVRQRRQRLEKEVDELTVQTGRARSAVRPALGVALRGVRDKDLTASLKALADQQDPGDDPGNDPATDSAARVVAALDDARTLSEKVRDTGRLLQEEVVHRKRWPTLVTFGVLLLAAILLCAVTAWPLAGKLLAVLGAVVAGLTPALAAMTNVLRLAREAREARELPLVEKREELAQTAAEEQAAGREVERHEHELARLRDKGMQLQEFVRERATSSDYRSRLGVISQVRRDFEELVGLLPGGRTEGAEQVAVVAAEVARRVGEVGRIVLFIDDLDRCPHEKVVEVLQAVHLLLAFKLFVVVVGVDSRWLERSLTARYTNLLEEPDRYLEKIFQIPFRLRSMASDGYRDLIAELTTQSRASTGTEGTGGAADTADTAGTADTAPSSGAGAVAAGTAGAVVPEPRAGDGASTPAAVSGEAAGSAPESEAEPAQRPPMPSPEKLTITPEEQAFLGELGALIPTPRAAKRLVNIYRMLRVGVSDSELVAFGPGPQGASEYEAVALLLAILVGRPASAIEVFAAIMSADDEGDVRDVLVRFPQLQAPVAGLLQRLTCTRLKVYRRWAPTVSRFSFQLAGAAPKGSGRPGPAGRRPGSAAAAADAARGVGGRRNSRRRP